MEYTRGIDSRFPVSELANKIKERGVKDKKTKKNAYQMEYSVRGNESSPKQIDLFLEFDWIMSSIAN